MADTGKWFHAISRTPEEVEEEYDEISLTYDNKLTNSGYSAPNGAAEILSSFIPPQDNMHILDAGCGTGLVGMELKNRGYTKIVGADISQNCLSEAKKKGAYESTLKHNLLEPFPFNNNTFDVVTCIGVCSRFDDPTILEIVEEFQRLIRKDGLIVLSHREDLMQKSNFAESVGKEKCQNLKVETVTEPTPYMPHDEHYANINVQYIVMRKIH